MISLSMMSYTLAEPYQSYEEIKKSRFMVYVAPINSIQQAQNIIANKSDHTATHNCWAWKLGQQYRFNDDGEPTGTAGKPILNAIEGQHCDNVLAIVTRWFGGIKLGTGGLSRAYGGGTARCLQQAPLIAIVPHLCCELHCYYNEWPILENKLHTLDAIILNQTYDAEGTALRLSVPQQTFEFLQQWINDLTRGRVSLKKIIN